MDPVSNPTRSPPAGGAAVAGKLSGVRRWRTMMKAESQLSKTLCGIAGEYFVAAELSRRGFIASITLRNTRGVDILVSNEDATRSVGIQVKTTQRGAKQWPLNRKVEEGGDETATNLFFVFVNLNGTGAPEYHIVPKHEVAAFTRSDYEQWLKTPGRGGRMHKENAIRVFNDHGAKYLNRWDLLGL
jgi:hypothetical protein